MKIWETFIPIMGFSVSFCSRKKFIRRQILLREPIRRFSGSRVVFAMIFLEPTRRFQQSCLSVGFIFKKRGPFSSWRTRKEKIIPFTFTLESEEGLRSEQQKAITQKKDWMCEILDGVKGQRNGEEIFLSFL